MKHTAIVTAFAASLALGAFAAQAKLPPAPLKTDAEQAAAAQKASAAKAHAAADVQMAEDKAVANYRKNKGIAIPMAEKKHRKK